MGNSNSSNYFIKHHTMTQQIQPPPLHQENNKMSGYNIKSIYNNPIIEIITIFFCWLDCDSTLCTTVQLQRYEVYNSIKNVFRQKQTC